MNAAQFALVGAVLVVAAGLGRWFFGPKPTTDVEVDGGIQEIRVTVRGGYTPNRIRARASAPLRLVLDRQESGDCTSRGSSPTSEPQLTCRR
jgi:Cu+-exporting ATPase